MTILTYVPDVFEFVVGNLEQVILYTLSRHPNKDLSDVVISGPKIQDATLSVKVIRTSDGKESHSHQGVNVRHYRFTAPLPRSPVIEYLHVELVPDQTFEAFWVPYTANLQKVVQAPGCHGLSLGQQVENPQEAVLFVGWERLEDHIPGFFEGPLWDEYLQGALPILDKYVKDGASGMEYWHIRNERGH